MPKSEIKTRGLAIRFDGPPSPESGRFVEVEIDGASVSIGGWVDRHDGSWLLVLGPVYAAAPEMLAALKKARHRFSEQNEQVSSEVWRENYEAVKAIADAILKADGCDTRDPADVAMDVVRSARGLTGVVTSESRNPQKRGKRA